MDVDIGKLTEVIPEEVNEQLRKLNSNELLGGYRDTMLQGNIIYMDISPFTDQTTETLKIAVPDKGTMFYREIDELPCPEEQEDYICAMFDVSEVKLLSRKPETGEHVFSIGENITLPNGKKTDGFSILKCYMPTEEMNDEQERYYADEFARQICSTVYFGDLAEAHFPKIVDVAFEDRPKSVELRQLKECVKEGYTGLATKILACRYYPFDLMYTLTESGRDLTQVLRENNLSLGRKIDILLDVAKALNFIHSIDMVHGDVKCSNVIVNEAGAAKMIDFGTMKHKGDRSSELTPIYASPDQLYAGLYEEDFEADSKNDMFSFGLTMYKTLDGEDYRKSGDDPYKWLHIPGQEKLRVRTGNTLVDEKLNEVIFRTTRNRSKRYDANKVVDLLTEAKDILAYNAVAAA